MRRFVLAAVAALLFVPAAHAWTWPSGGPVLRPFVLGDDPYAGGQHRGIDVGGELGSDVRAPASGTVSFAGTVPGSGKTITLQTADGYAVTLLQLGELLVAKGDAVEEGVVVARIGPSADSVTTEPHVHLGVRVAADPDGYVDPLALLPPRREPAAPEPEPAPSPVPVAAEAGATEPAAPVAPAAAAAPAAPVHVLAPIQEAPEAPRPSSGHVHRVRAEPADAPAPAGRRPESPPAAKIEPATVVTPARALPPVRPEARLHTVAPKPRQAVAVSGELEPIRPVAAAHRRLTAAPSPTPGANRLVLPALAGAAALAAAIALLVRRRGRPMMGADALEPGRTEDPRGGGMAVCERPEAHRSRRRLRRPLGHLRALPPPQGGRRPHGQRDGRARDARHGRRRRRGPIAA
jgi:hypothetical protein